MSHIYTEILDILRLKGLLDNNTHAFDRATTITKLLNNTQKEYKTNPTRNIKLQMSAWFSMLCREILSILIGVSRRPENMSICQELFKKLEPCFSELRPLIHRDIKFVAYRDFLGNAQMNTLVNSMEQLQGDIAMHQMMFIKYPTLPERQTIQMQIEFLKSYYCAILVLINNLNPNHEIFKYIVV